MKKIKNKNGITLMALVITIILLLILASIGTYSGIQVVKFAQFTAFSTELEIMQTQVNKLYEEKSNGDYVDNLGTTIDNTNSTVKTHANNAFNACNIKSEDQEKYKYFDTDTIKSLNIEGVEGKFFVNIDKRSVVSYDGFEYEGETYYTLAQLPDGLYNIEYNAKNSDSNNTKPSIDKSNNITVEKIGDNKWTISVKNISYAGNIKKWKLYYKLDSEENYNVSNDLNLKLEKEGKYNIKVCNGETESDEYDVIIKNLQIGDYVNYNPAYLDVAKTQAVDSSKLTYTSEKGTATEHGNGYVTQTFQVDSNTKWRVLNILDDNKIELISEKKIKKKESDSSGYYIFRGAIGYLYADQELNEICKIYGYGYGADMNCGGIYKKGGILENQKYKIQNTGGRSVDIEDINKIAKVGETNDGANVTTTFKQLNNNYGRTDKPIEEIFYPTTNVEQGDVTTGISNNKGIKNIKETYYRYDKTLIENSKKADLFFDDTYWIVSRYERTFDYYCEVGIRYVQKGQRVYPNELGEGKVSEFKDMTVETYKGVRPIVTLKSDTINYSNLTQTTGEDGNAWQLK